MYCSTARWCCWTNGVPSFAALADRMHGPVAPRIAQARPVTFMVFDVLRLYGVPLLDRPFAERRGTLERLELAAVDPCSRSPRSTPTGAALLEATRQRGMEGVVAKRRDSVYRPGRRSPNWSKVAHRHSQACLVGGWRPERSSANRIGALLLGVPDGGALRYVGRVGLGAGGRARCSACCGSGWSTGAAPPFAGRLPRADAAGARWCEPLTVVEVSHTGWTDGRAAVASRVPGVRDDLDPAHVEREG